MPMYEYVSVEDGETIELLRPMTAADDPVDDPKGLGRKFVRKLSVFGVSGEAGATGVGGGHVHSGMCGCGKRQGGCGGMG